MPKTENKINISENVMALIRDKKAKIKPKWHFLLSFFLMTGGLVGLIILIIFSISLMSFAIRTHGPMESTRLTKMLLSFPWWAVFITIAGFGFSVKILKKYDFSYKKNFLLIIFSLFLSIVLTGWLIDYTRIDNFWIKKRPLKEFYQKYDGGNKIRENGGGPSESRTRDFSMP